MNTPTSTRIGNYVLYAMTSLAILVIILFCCAPWGKIRARQAADAAADNVCVTAVIPVSISHPVSFTNPPYEPKRKIRMTGTDITQGYILQSQPVVDTTSDIVFTIAPGSPAYTALATWVAYRVANPGVTAPLFFMGDYEPPSINAHIQTGGGSLSVNGGSVALFPMIGGVFDDSGAYSFSSLPAFAGTFFEGPYDIICRGSYTFSNIATAVLDSINPVVLTIQQASDNSYAGHNVKLIILPDTQVTGQTEEQLWNNIGGATPAGLQCATPIYMVDTGDNLHITCATPGASIRYTTDGSTPSEVNGTVYTVPVVLTSTTTLQAIAYKTGMTDSTVASVVYTISTPTVATPTISLPAGTYTSPQELTLSDATSGATLSITLDNSTPTQTNGTSEASIVVPVGVTTVKAIAYKTGYIDSAVFTAVYSIPCAAPSINLPSGTYSTAQMIVLTTATRGAGIRYTEDHTFPTANNGTIYTAPFVMDSSETLQAVAYASGCPTSPISSAQYLMQVATPILTLLSGQVSTPQTLALNNITPGALIYYSLDGSIPTSETGMLYTTPLSIEFSTILTAIASYPGWSDSVPLIDTVTITDTVVTVLVSPTNMTVVAGDSTMFIAQVLGLENQQVGWSVVESDSGGITPEGEYYAPERPGVYHIQATSLGSPSNSGIATVTVVPLQSTRLHQRLTRLVTINILE